MLDLARLNAIRLRPRPLFQRVVGYLFLGPNLHWPFSPTRIIVEGAEHVPPGGAMFVMNHTDRYNYWPFQYALWRRGLGYTATWVKGKYYENRLLGWFMDAGNNIPVPSKGYVISKDFVAFHGRPPDRAEYAALRAIADGKLDKIDAGAPAPPGVQALLDRDPAPGYRASLEARFSAMMARFVAINGEALQMGLHLLVFPEGTRQHRLGRGHTGAAQIALATSAPVIPVGCSGSDRCYPGNSPFSRGGTITYRIGAPLRPSAGGELAPFHTAVQAAPFVPFTPSADRHAQAFRAMTDLLMDRINGLVDPPYQYDPHAQPPAPGPGEGGDSDGANRFL